MKLWVAYIVMHLQVAGKGPRFPVGRGPQNGGEHAVAGSAKATFQHVGNHFTELIGQV